MVTMEINHIVIHNIKEKNFLASVSPKIKNTIDKLWITNVKGHKHDIFYIGLRVINW